MSTYKSFIKNNLVVLAGHILIYAQGMILMPVIIKTCGTTVYGGYILLMTLSGFVFGISSFGVGFQSGRFLPAAEGRDAKLALFYPQFCFHFLSITCLSLAFILFYPFLDKFFFNGELVFSKWLVFPFLVFNFIYSQTVNYFLCTHKVSRFNYATVAFPYINIALIVLIYTITHHLSVNILFSTQIISYIVLIAPLTVMLIREIGFKFMLPDLTSLLEDMRLGLPLRLNFMMDFLLGSSDRYLITCFLTVAAVGYYSPGYALGSLIVFFPRVSGVVLTPLLSKAIDTGKVTEAHTMFNYTIKGFLLLAIPFIFGAAVLSRPLLNLFANAEVSHKAYMVTPVIATATLFFGLNIIFSNVLWVRMKTSVILIMNTFAAVINLALNIIFLYLFKNVLVSAFTTLISYLIVFIFVRRAVAMDWPVHFEFNTIIKSIAASVFMGVALYWMSSHFGNHAYRVWLLVSEILIGIVAYIFALFAMKTFSHKELLYFKNAFS